MRHGSVSTLRRAAIAAALVAALTVPGAALAHCDTMDGPVVAAARTALDTGDPAPVFAWVRAEDEAAIGAALESARTVRAQSDAARELADRYFFETLVRVHRAGEGFPFTGLQPAGAPIAPAIRAADAALASGEVDELVSELTSAVEKGVRERFAHARQARVHGNESVAAGRAFVATYVQLTHYVEALEATSVGHGGAHGASGEEGAAHGPEGPAAHAHD